MNCCIKVGAKTTNMNYLFLLITVPVLEFLSPKPKILRQLHRIIGYIHLYSAVLLIGDYLASWILPIHKRFKKISEKVQYFIIFF
jgi:hypothetical protein